MAYSEKLAQRVRQYFAGRDDISERKMFGGLAFMVGGHMCVGIDGDDLMARVGRDNYQRCLERKYVRQMDFTGKPLRGFVFVDSEGVKTKKSLYEWIGLCESFVFSLPPK